MRRCSIHVIAILGAVLVMSIQLIWMYYSYNFVKSELVIKTTKMLEMALEKETFSRLYKVPQGAYVEGKGIDDVDSNLSEFVYLQESLEKLDLPVSVDSVGLYFRNLLIEKDFPVDVKLMIIKADTILQEIGMSNESPLAIQTNELPLRTDYSVVLKGILVHPEELFYKRMGNLFVTTACLMVFAVICIILQIQTIRKQKKIAKARESFTYALVHDMKTPLTSIMATLRFLYTGQLEKKPEIKERFCSIALTETDNLLALTNRVLTIAKLESNKLDMNKHIVELQPMVDELTEKFTAQGTKPIHFNVCLDTLYVYADDGYLKEVISNLIDNAIKYSGEEVDICIASVEEERYTVIKVRDNGFGISLKDQRIIFNKFERGEATGRRKGGASGFGLGLNFVNQVVEAHGGRVLLQSIKGEFTEFEIYLPKENYEEIVREYQKNKSK